LIGAFQNVLEEILSHNFLRIEVGLKLFFIWSLEMVVGSFESKVLKHWNCCWGPVESKVLKHWNCCWGPLWK